MTSEDETTVNIEGHNQQDTELHEIAIVEEPKGEAEAQQPKTKTLHWQIPISSFPIVEVPEKAHKSIKNFYNNQNEVVEEMRSLYEKLEAQKEKARRFKERNHLSQVADISVKPVDGGANIVQEQDEEGEQESLYQKDERLSTAQLKFEGLCIHLSMWINVMLAVVKLASSIISNSLSVITSTFDSFLDLLVGLILWITNRMRNKMSASARMQYPVGRARLEPLGFIIFASVMSTASLFLIVEAVQQIAEGAAYMIKGIPQPENVLAISDDPYILNVFYWVGVGALGFTIIVKFLLWLLCRRGVSFSSACDAYATDHMNDVLTNIVALVAVLVTQWIWWFDPAGAIFLSAYIVYRWSKETIPHVLNLVGRVADREFVNKVTFMAMNHNENIQKVDTVQAWYMGAGLYVELDIVVDPQLPLPEAHDIAEELQLLVEQLSDVERCYVHIDYEYEHSHRDEHLRV
ncbi:metal tolerance protein [Acrasis kona]|uniref:Metal tolerance protein n=1 Tax=Acrasis kona TaxID=1008807 RepID=A0AAW2ZBP1_9EUKA